MRGVILGVTSVKVGQKLSGSRESASGAYKDPSATSPLAWGAGGPRGRARGRG